MINYTVDPPEAYGPKGTKFEMVAHRLEKGFFTFAHTLYVHPFGKTS